MSNSSLDNQSPINKTDHPPIDHNVDGDPTSDPFDKPIGSVIVVMAITATLLNLYLLKMVVKLRMVKQNKANPTLILMLSLAVSDTLYSVLPMCLSAYTLLHGRVWGTSLGHQILCNAAGIVFSVTVKCSILVILVLSLTRVIAIKFPVQYRSLTSPTNLYVALSVVWVLSLLVALLPFLVPNSTSYKYISHVALCNFSLHAVFPNPKALLAAHILVMVLPFVIPGTITLFLYVVILVSIVKMKLTDMKRKLHSRAASNSFKQLKKKEDKKGRRQLIVSTVTTLVLVGLFCLCYTPWWSLSIDFLVAYVMKNQQSLIMKAFNLSVRNYYDFIVMSYVSILLNSNINPIIHILAVKKLKSGLKSRGKKSQPLWLLGFWDVVYKRILEAAQTLGRRHSPVSDEIQLSETRERH